MKKALGCFGWLMVIIVGIALLIVAAPLALVVSIFAWWYFNKKDNEKYTNVAKLSTVVSALGTVFFIYAINNPTEPEITTTPVEQSSSVKQVDIESEETEESKIIEEETKPLIIESLEEVDAEPTEEVEESEEEVATREQRNALASAKSYLSWAGMSEQGLRDQLSYEEFPQAAIDYAIENVEVNYNEQALIKAESYNDWANMSDQGLIDQLLYEGFTQEQAQYAIDNLK